MSEPQEPQVITYTSTHPHSTPNSPPAFSAGLQTSSGNGIGDGIGDAVGEFSPEEGGNTPTPARDGSITPTQENHNAIALATQSIKGLWGRLSSRNRRIESGSDEGGGPDIAGGNESSAGTHPPPPIDPQNEPSSSRHGKGRRVEPYSDEETGSGVGNREDVHMEESSPNAQDRREYGGVRFISVPIVFNAHLRKNRPATEDDILRLCQSFHSLTRELVKEVVKELRRLNSQRGDRSDYAADDEAERDGPRRSFRKPKSRYPGIRRRPVAQNNLSVGCPALHFHH